MSLCHYDAWRTGYDELGYDPREDDYIKITDVPDLKGIREYFAEIVKQLYTESNLDIGRLDDRLFWIAQELGLDVPDGQPTILRK